MNTSITAIEEADTMPRMDLNVPELVTNVTVRTFERSARAIFGPVAYLGKGAELYDAFKKSSPTNEEKQLFIENRQAISEAIKDTERAIIVGCGPLAYFEAQELLILKQPQLKNLKEIVLIDVSLDYLNENVAAAAQLLEKKRELEERRTGKKLPADSYQVKVIRDDYRNVASHASVGLESYLEEPLQTTVFATGGLFGNIENPDTDSFPIHAIQEEEAHFAKLGGVGSKILATYFYKAENQAATSYYQTPELSRFFLNIPKTIYDNCLGLEGFSPTPDNFAYVPRWNDDARFIEHRLKILKPQRPTITLNNQTRVLDLRRDDEFIMMVSGRFEPVRISEIPTQNTGLTVNRTFMGQEMALQLFYTQGMPNNISFQPSRMNGQEGNIRHGGLASHDHSHHTQSRQVAGISALTETVKSVIADGRARFAVGPRPAVSLG